MAICYTKHMTSKYIKRTYRITKEQDKWVKKNKSITGSESASIRRLIDYMIG